MRSTGPQRPTPLSGAARARHQRETERRLANETVVYAIQIQRQTGCTRDEAMRVAHRRITTTG